MSQSTTSTSSLGSPSELSEVYPNHWFKLSSSAVSTPFSENVVVGHDYTIDLPDECLARIFQFLGTGDRKRCSLVCPRWLSIDGQSRHGLSLKASAEMRSCIPNIFRRFNSITKLALRCDRKLISIGDDSLVQISLLCGSLTSVKLRGCSELTDEGMADFAQNCKGLKKLSWGSCMFGAKAVNAVLNHCTALEELSVKCLRGLQDSAEPIRPGAAASSLKSIYLKDLVHGQKFEPLIVGSKKLKTLKLIRCSGEWDKVLDKLGESNTGLTEIHLEKVQVSDVGLRAISNCSNLEILHIVKTPACSNSGLVCVAEHCRLLRKLHIDAWRTNDGIGDEGLIAVANQCSNLQELILIGMNPTLTSLTPIASNCQKLERLALCRSGTIGDAQIACIAAECAALKKLCIWDEEIEALGFDCANLVKVEVNKCKGVRVSTELADWLREGKGSLFVIMDRCKIEPLDGSGSELGVQESGMEFPTVEFQPIISQGTMVADVAASSNSRMTMFRTKFGYYHW